jgi:hypothetical protein
VRKWARRMQTLSILLRPVHLHARMCPHCLRDEIDTAEHIQQMRRTRRLFALIAVTIVAAVVGAVASFMVSPDPPPRPQMQTAVDASSTRAASEAMVEVAAPVVAPAQATERPRPKISIYWAIRLSKAP